MNEGLIPKINQALTWSFYAIFFLTPLVVYPETYELFEFNKMWLVFIISVIIFFLWGTKMLIQGKFEIRRTPLDIPIALFLVSQIISTIISIEPHTSLWGYYSRFNGGLFSIFAYIFLYYAFATNMIGEEKLSFSYKSLFVSLISGLIVTLWGLPSHFGYDPTCFMFRGSFDTSCWTEQFKPTIRIFSTLGQPNWMGTYVAALIPISLGFGLYKLRDTGKKFLRPGLFLGLSFLFFLALLYTRSQSSFLGLGTGMVIFVAFFLIANIKQIKESLVKTRATRFVLIAIAMFAVATFIVGSPIASLNKYTSLEGLQSLTQKKTEKTASPEAGGLANSTEIRLGGSESSDIRLIVWKGALELFRRNPLFGTGVETFAYAYYQVKPVEHNLTSEWDYLYNKAHNEYLNFLATTGIVGLGTYLLVIATFIFVAVKTLLKRKSHENYPILVGVLSGYAAILVSNFFGFSVVIINVFFFLFPIIFFELSENKKIETFFALPRDEKNHYTNPSALRMAGMLLVGLFSLYFLFYLINFWFADKSYALGYNLNKAGEYSQAYQSLSDAAKTLPSEDLYKDELSINMATLAILLSQNNQATEAAQFANQALSLSDEILTKHPQNVVYYKTAIRVQYALAQIDPKFIDQAIKLTEKARKLAPTDAKLVYNLALFYNQKGDNNKMLELLDDAIKLKPNYYDPFYAKVLLFSQLVKEDPKNAEEYKAKAHEAADYVFKNIDPNNKQIKEILDTL